MKTDTGKQRIIITTSGPMTEKVTFTLPDRFFNTPGEVHSMHYPHGVTDLVIANAGKGSKP